jgi:hypothetical protein
MNAITSDFLPIVQNRIQSHIRLFEPEFETIPVTPRPDVFQTRISHEDGRHYRGMMLHTNPHCVYCGCEVNSATSNLEHVLPRSRGGDNKILNLALACLPCNEAKDDRTLSEWAEEVREALERLQSLSSNLDGLLASGLEVYEATKPRGIHSHRNPVPVAERKQSLQNKPKRSKTETLYDSKERFRTSRRLFNLVAADTRRTLVRGMRPTDLAHYIEEVGFDNCGSILLVAEQHWHPESGGPGPSFNDDCETDFLEPAPESDGTQENNRVEKCRVS